MSLELKFSLTGEKVRLRPTLESDLQDYQRWNDVTSRAMQLDGPWYGEDLSAVIATRERRLAETGEPPFRFLEIETITGVHVGWVTVYHRQHDPHRTEVGVGIHEDAYWGQGMGSEALGLWVDHLFSERGLGRFGFTTWSGNQGMIKVGEKLGFVLEGRIRRGCEVKGRFFDIIHMGVLREEWGHYKAM